MEMLKGNNERKQELRKILVELRDVTRQKIAQEMGTKLDEDSRMSTLSTMDNGDLSQLDLDRDIDYTLLHMYIERLRNVEDALDRLEEGSYGYCEDCGGAIKLKRLKVLPFTKYCVPCQEEQEKLGPESKLRLRKMTREGEFELQGPFL